MKRLTLFGFSFLLFLATYPVQESNAQKKDLTLEDYAQWQRLGVKRLSPDGNWFAYQVAKVEEDGWLAVKRVSGGDEMIFDFASRPFFSDDSQWLAFSIGVSQDDQKKAEKDEKPVKLKLGLMNLQSQMVDTLAYVESFAFSEDGRFLAMRKYKDDKAEAEGSDLVVRDLSAGTNMVVGNVKEYGFSFEGSLLAVVIDSYDDLGNGVHLMDPATGTTRVLKSNTTSFTNLEWSEEDFHLAFLEEVESDEETEGSDHIVHAYRGVDAGTASADHFSFNAEDHESFPAGHRIASEGSISWSEDGKRVFVGLKDRDEERERIKLDEEGEDEGKDDEGEQDGDDDGDDKEEPAEKEKPNKTNADRDEDLDPSGVDIWHWNDGTAQPQQKVRASRDRDATYLTAWTLDSDAFVKLADSDRSRVTLSGDQSRAVLFDATPYQPAFREAWNDIYVKNVESGQESKVLERIESVQVSPGGDYILYWRDDNWHTVDVKTLKHVTLTHDVPTRFNNFKAIYGREADRAWGSAQWVEGDDWFLAYDEYDVYKIFADGSATKRLTFGAEDRIRFRQQRLDFEEDALKAGEDIYFNAYGDFTKDSGYYRLSKDQTTEDEAQLIPLLYESKSVSGLIRADDAEVYVFQTQKADESPNFFVVDKDFDSPVQLTNTNPQQDEYHWGKTELVTYTNADGVTLQGRLLYPADYEEGKQYPMMVYIYELRSQSLHSYTLPSRTNAYNQRRYSSEGYFVFEPDIIYKLRDPGRSAVDCIVPAVEQVLATGMVDPAQIGLTGHSWGAYQTAFVVSQTDLFAAAVAGAPLTNMISMYNSVYWNSGSSDASIFEVSQGRFPDPYWNDWDKFVENSPIFNAQSINTPLMIAFGDNDGAVDFNQGVEMYNTMRRLEKPFVMLVYEGENHGNRKKENQIDYANRSQDWFNHFLKGGSAAGWITDGIPYLEKELEKEKQAKAAKKKTNP